MGEPTKKDEKEESIEVLRERLNTMKRIIQDKQSKEGVNTDFWKPSSKQAGIIDGNFLSCSKMGLTKQYLRYQPVNNFNIIGSARSNVVFTTLNNTEGRYIAVGGAENVLLWDLRVGEKVFELKRAKEEVCRVAASPDKKHIAVGYFDGVVEIFNLETKLSVCTFSIHRTAISCLRYDQMGLRILSGGLDTEIVVSDVVAQAGKCRLIGHTGPITEALFMNRYENIVVSCSKDTQIKFWDIETQFCFKTIVDHRNEVWGISLMRYDSFLVTASSDTSLRVYNIEDNDISTTTVNTVESGDLMDDSASPLKCNFSGVIQRLGRGRTMNLISDVSGTILGCHGTDTTIELFYFCSEEETTVRLKKRLKKLSKSLNLEDSTKNNEVSLTDKIKRLTSIKAEGKVKSFDLLMGTSGELRITASFANNILKLFSLNYKDKNAEAALLRSISLHGHHTEVRTVAFSSDNLAIASGSGDTVKLWNRNTTACLRTVTADYALCTCFVPGDRHILVGTKSGHLLIIDVVVGEIIEDIPAHESEVWSVCLFPDMRGCVTGGDKTTKFWSFELIPDPKDEHKQILSLLHKSTLSLDESVMCVRLSKNNKYVVVALLDSTVKIFFADTFKFYLSLYGHNLPVLCMDISYDSTIVVTGSADRNVKIWGMDFGDCHRSMFAHDDSVMSIQFIPKTHLFFTCGKDGKIKQWDADTFQKILTLPGHIGEAHALAVSPNGKYLVTAGSDRVIRLFERTDEPLVLQDVQEEEREEMENRTLTTGAESNTAALPNLKLPSRKTVGAEKAAESILECIEVSKDFDMQDNKNDIPALMQAFDAKNSDDFLINVLQRIRATDMDEGLLLLPFSAVCDMLKRMPHLIQTRKDQTELLCKVVLFCFKVHQKPLMNTQSLLPTIREIHEKLDAAIVALRDLIGFNMYGLTMIQRQIESNDGVELFRDASKEKKEHDKKKKKRQLAKRVHIQMTT
uniref:CSON000766 protein n=1 Tax=Culicoides sonorensis TaxID=179676 RepID=A0A336KWX1_CULSO